MPEMTDEDERRIAELLAMSPVLLQPEAIELRSEVERLRAELADARSKKCTCDGDPIECSHEAARGQAEAERARLTERLAEAIYIARQIDVGDTDVRPFSTASPRVRTQYLRKAAEVARLVGEFRDQPADVTVVITADTSGVEDGVKDATIATLEHQITALTQRAEAAEAERAPLAEQVERARATAAELHEFNSPEGEHPSGCMGCRLEGELGQELGR
ncbi:hypothetical protein [Actinomadura litoris]|uniref:hypothetical protein n=1 Tax=Actinomadura litoris TaxID=2678616 RepID=UPI001FA714B4|nr:hypothetical protein [Actinomadura litoris]